MNLLGHGGPCVLHVGNLIVKRLCTITTWNVSVQITLANVLKHCKTHLKHIPVFSVTLLLVKLTKNVAILIQVAADVCLHKQANAYVKLFHSKELCVVIFLGTQVPCTLGWPYIKGIWLYCDYFIWYVSCAVVVLTCFVMCGYVYVGGKQWQPTPKKLPRMQRARAIPVAWLGSGSCQNRPSGWILMMMIYYLNSLYWFRAWHWRCRWGVYVAFKWFYL